MSLYVGEEALAGSVDGAPDQGSGSRPGLPPWGLQSDQCMFVVLPDDLVIAERDLGQSRASTRDSRGRSGLEVDDAQVPGDRMESIWREREGSGVAAAVVDHRRAVVGENVDSVYTWPSAENEGMVQVGADSERLERQCPYQEAGRPEVHATGLVGLARVEHEAPVGQGDQGCDRGDGMEGRGDVLVGEVDDPNRLRVGDRELLVVFRHFGERIEREGGQPCDAPVSVNDAVTDLVPRPHLPNKKAVGCPAKNRVGVSDQGHLVTPVDEVAPLEVRAVPESDPGAGSEPTPRPTWGQHSTRWQGASWASDPPVTCHVV